MKKDMVIVGDVYLVQPDHAFKMDPFETLVLGVNETHVYYTFMDEFERNVDPKTGEGFYHVYPMLIKVWQKEDHDFVKNIPLTAKQKTTIER